MFPTWNSSPGALHAYAIDRSKTRPFAKPPQYRPGGATLVSAELEYPIDNPSSQIQELEFRPLPSTNLPEELEFLANHSPNQDKELEFPTNHPTKPIKELEFPTSDARDPL